MKRVVALLPVVVAAALMSFFVASARAVSSVQSTTIATFSDALGETPGSPDIGKVTVSLDGDVLTVQADVVGMPEIMSDGAVLFMLNTDSNSTTGKYDGADYILFMDMETLAGMVLRWNGSDYVDADKVADPSRTLIGGSSAGFMFNLANFGSPRHIEFSMTVLKGTPDSGLLDVAPDVGLWAFDVVVPTPTPTPVPTPAPVAVKPVIASPVATPRAPLAGKPMTVVFPVTRSDNGQALTTGKLICDPSVGGKVIPHTESFKAGKARLSFVVPKAAKGGVLKVKVTIKTGDRTTTRIATFRVR